MMLNGMLGGAGGYAGASIAMSILDRAEFSEDLITNVPLFAGSFAGALAVLLAFRRIGVKPAQL
jgi:hypothetical protein